MIGFQVNDQFLPLAPGTKVAFRLSYKVDVDDDELIPGSYTVPITIPLSPTTRKILQYPDRTDAAGVKYKIPNCTFWTQGIPFKSGTLKVSSAQRGGTVKISLLIDDFTEIKNTYISELDLPTIIEATPNAMHAHAMDTLSDPLDHDHAFIPVRNQEFTDVRNIYRHPDTDRTEHTDALWYYQNYYDQGNDTLAKGYRAKNISPFIRWDYIMERCITKLGQGLVNEYQSTDELKLLYVYHNNSIARVDLPSSYTEPADDSADLGWPSSFSYADNLPKVLVADFIRHSVRSLLLHIRFDSAAKRVTIEPIDTIMSRGHVYDWTTLATPTYTNQETPSPISYMGYADDLNDNISRVEDIEGYEQNLITSFGPLIGILGSEDAPTVPGLYYQPHLQRYAVYTSATSAASALILKRHYVSSEDGKPYLLKAAPLLTWKYFDQYSPLIKVPGSGSYLVEEDILNAQGSPTGNIQYAIEQQRNEFKDIRLIQYRGYRDGYPYANPSTYDPETNDQDYYTNSLLLDGTSGQLSRAKRYLEYIDTRLSVLRSLNLTIKHLLNYQKGQKVRIENQNYFIEEMNPVFTHQGIEPVSCKMSTVA